MKKPLPHLNPLSRKLKGKVLVQGTCTSGYRTMQLGFASRTDLSHRVVAIAFVDGHAANLEVNHINGDKPDNRSANLEWVTKSQNTQHSYDFLPRKQHKLTCPVRVGGTTYPSNLAAAKAVGVCVGTISSALKKGHLTRGMEVQYA